MKGYLFGGGLIVLTIASSYLFYGYQEQEFYRKKRVHCELFEISKILNSYYAEHKVYPLDDDWINEINSNLYSVKCGRTVPVVNGEVLDPWGEAYRFDIFSKGRVDIYSENLEGLKVNLKNGGAIKNGATR
ncbi:hypothetical protein [Microbulbifer sp. TRSA005]|uniref:hypothetical protein n=1 Tax=unclassified Microbulbifer TaxID=2619833 RepID=UPI004039A381